MARLWASSSWRSSSAHLGAGCGVLASITTWPAFIDLLTGPLTYVPPIVAAPDGPRVRRHGTRWDPAVPGRAWAGGLAGDSEGRMRSPLRPGGRQHRSL